MYLLVYITGHLFTCCRWCRSYEFFNKNKFLSKLKESETHWL